VFFVKQENEFWTELTPEEEKAARELPGDLNEAAQAELQSIAGILGQEPYGAGLVQELTADQGSHNDPLGSWTGVPEGPDAYETPTQDADDL